MNALNPGLSPALQRLGEVSVRLSVELGRTDMALRDVLALAEGSVVSLDRLTDELLDITANGQVIAHGEVVAQDGKFALRIVSLAGGDAPASGPPPSAAPPSTAPRPDAPIPGQMPQPTPTAPEPSPPALEEAGTEPLAELSEPLAQDAPEAAEAEQEPDIDELTAALEETLGDAPAEEASEEAPPEEASSEEPESDPLMDALDELPEVADDPAGEGAGDGDGDGGEGE